MRPPPGPLRAMGLLLRLRALRALSVISARLTRFGKPKVARSGSRPKGKAGRILSVAIAASMLLSTVDIAWMTLRNIDGQLGRSFVPASQLYFREAGRWKRVPRAYTPGPNERVWVWDENRMVRGIWDDASGTFGTLQPTPPAAGHRVAANVLSAEVLEAFLIGLAVLLMTLGSKELALPDWDLEWLVTLPMGRRTLLFSRIVERTVVNPTGLLCFWPFLTMIAWQCGHRWSAPVLGALETLVLLSAVAVVQTLVDTGLRLRLSPPKLRNLQAMLSIVAILSLYLAMAMGLGFGSRSFVMDWAVRLPRWTHALPPGLAIEALTADRGIALGAAGALVLQTALIFLLGIAWLSGVLSRGIVSVGIREAGGRSAIPRQARTKDTRRRLLTPVQSRELSLLGRDRTFLVQTLVLPAVLFGMQWLMNPSRGGIRALAAHHPGGIAAAAFALGAYGLIFSSLQTLNAEGKALWLLYTVPQRLESILRQKAALWACLALAYPALILAWGFHVLSARAGELAGLSLIVLIGVPVFAVIATALGVFACDPLTTEIQRKVRPSYVYLYMGLASLYGYALYGANAWQRGMAIFFSLILALALWQRARDHLPFLLDPAASPPPRVSLSDGILAAVAFFALQAVVYAFTPDLPLGQRLVLAFGVAGGATYGLTRLIYWKTSTQDVPRLWGPLASKGIAWGMALGLVAAALALVYVRLISRAGFVPEVPGLDPDAQASLRPWFAVLAVVGAPLFEEFIFRGLVHGGLRRLVGVFPAALASALLFAMVHPPTSVLPVFLLGLCAALVYERTRALAAPMAAHAVYNLVVIAGQWG